VIWRLLLFEIVALVVVVGVWFGAPLVGITSVLWRVVIILALLLPPIVLIVILRLQERKAASGLEDAIKEQGRVRKEQVRPDRRAEVEELTEAFDKAVASLKTSRLAQGKSALYALPWYMIIGPPAVGKSTALLHSGLKFPFTTGDKKVGKVKGVGGTRNCDWWFSDQAILLDTAGRYASEEDDVEEWLGFLRLLKRYRRKRPLNGLIVATAVSDLMKNSPEEIEEQAAQLRSRIDQVVSELELALPVYILFTKCDLIAGFIQFFGSLTQSARSQIFGFTVPLTTRHADVDRLFDDEFGLLLDRLQHRALGRLATAKGDQRGAVYQFPLQFAAVREQFRSFVGHLMVANPYVETPRVRGIYFCSGTQEGRPLDRVLAGMSRALGLRELSSAGFEQNTQKKSYFLRDVFTQVLFPDQEVAGTTAKGLSRRRRLGIIGLAAALLASVGVVGPTAVTYSGNRQLVQRTTEVAKNSRITTPEDPRRVLDSLKALDDLGAILDRLREYSAHGAPWSMSLGYYQGNRILNRVERVYVRRMHQAFVLPAGTEVEATLIDVANAPDGSTSGASADFDLLKTYLMLTEPKRLEVKFAIPVLLAQWKKRLHPDVAQHEDLLATNVRRFLVLLKERKAKWLERDRDTVRNVQRVLISRDTKFQNLVQGIGKTLRPFTLRDALRNRIQSVLTTKDEVPAEYTRAGWERFVRKRLTQQLVKGSREDGWVLGEEEGKDAVGQLKQRYFERYIGAWKKFLRGLSMAPPTTAEESLRLLERLTESPAMYEELISSVAFNTQMPIGDPGKIKDAARLIRGRAGRLISKAQRLGLDKQLPRGQRNLVERTFLPIHELVATTSSDGRPQIPLIRQYLSQLEAVRDQLANEVKGGSTEPSKIDTVLEEARRVAKGLMATLPGDLRRSVSQLFYMPLDVAGSKASEAQANRASSTVADTLCAPYVQRLATHYPFSASQDDALLQDVMAFFAPRGLIWGSYESDFKSQLVQKGAKFAALPGKQVPRHVIAFFSQASRVSQALFPLGSDQVRLQFQVRPYPVVLQAGTQFQVSEIVLEAEGKSNTYRNGPPEQWSLIWTGQNTRAMLLVRGAGGLYEKIAFNGEWSLRRLVQRGKVHKRGSWYRVEWVLKGGKITIPMDFRPERTYNPLFMTMRLPCH